MLKSTSVVVALFLTTLIACAPKNGGTSDNSVRSATLDTWSFHFDRPIPAVADKPTNFDESVFFPMNFSLSQNDSRLVDLFSAKHQSELCFPTALTNALVYLYHYHTPPLNRLKFAGLSGDGLTLNGPLLVRNLVSSCHTDINDGTSPIQGLGCALQIFADSGYDSGDSSLVTWRVLSNPQSLPVEFRGWNIGDLRKFVARGDAVLLELGWYDLDSKKNKWVRHNGHSIGVYGYNYDVGWGDDQIELKVLNPESAYDNSGDQIVGDDIVMQKIALRTGEIYPTQNPMYTLIGRGFNGTKLPIVESIVDLDVK